MIAKANQALFLSKYILETESFSQQNNVQTEQTESNEQITNE